MGFFAGFVEEMRRSDDKEERRKEFMQQLLETRRNTVIPYVLNQIAAETELRREETQRINGLVRAGLSIESAVGLQRSGQLERVSAAISAADAAGKLDSQYVSDLDALIQQRMKDQLGEENYTTFANAIAAGITSGDPSTEEGRAVSVATALSTLYEAEDPFAAGGDIIERVVSQRDAYRGLPTINVGNISLTGVEQLPMTESARVRRAVTETLAGVLGSDNFERDALTGDFRYTGNDAATVEALTTTLSNQIVGDATGPSATMSLDQSVSTRLTPLTRLAAEASEAGTYSPTDLLRMVDPSLVVQPVAPPPVPAPGAAAEGVVTTPDIVDEPSWTETVNRNYGGGFN